MFASQLPRWVSFVAVVLLVITMGTTQAQSLTAAPLSSSVHLPQVKTTSAQTTAGRFFFVSKRGNNRDGRSWATAWNELDRINWAVVQPGDTIVIDGGAKEMRYTTTLTIRKSGVAGRPIIIRPSMHPGYNGKVIIFGGRSTPLPYCGQASYSYQTSGVRTVGISAKNVTWVRIDGLKWRGITIHGHNGNAIELGSSSNTIRVRNVEIYDNGTAVYEGGSWVPHHGRKGVNLAGTNITFERAIIHDNGADAFQSGGGLRNFTLRQSWIYNARRAPDGSAFNRCTHQDGVQIYGGGVQSGVTIEDSVIGPGLLHGVLLGESDPTGKHFAQINDVRIRHSLFYKSDHINISAMATTPKNWVIENVTSYRVTNAKHHNIRLGGTSGHAIRNSFFVGGTSMTVAAGLPGEGNCLWNVKGGSSLGKVVDPRFVNVAGDNYALQAGSPCAGKGSRVTSAQQLLSLPSAGTPTPQPSPQPSPQPTPQPTPAPKPDVTAWEAKAGTLAKPFVVENGMVSQSVATSTPSAGGRAAYRIYLNKPGSYVVKALLDAPTTASNSLYLNIDAEPTGDTMAWDIALTKGVQERTASWRGKGTVEQNEFRPKVFKLTAGEHTLIVRGREKGVRISKLWLVPVTPTN